MRNVHWLVWLSCKKFWKAAVVLERFKEYSNDPGQNCGSVLAFFFEVARAILQCFLRTHPTVYLFFLLSLLRKSWSIFTRVGEH